MALGLHVGVTTQFLWENVVTFKQTISLIQGLPWMSLGLYLHTPPKFNIAPEKWWLEDYFPIGKGTFQGLCETSGEYIYITKKGEINSNTHHFHKRILKRVSFFLPPVMEVSHWHAYWSCVSGVWSRWCHRRCSLEHMVKLVEKEKLLKLQEGTSFYTD